MIVVPGDVEHCDVSSVTEPASPASEVLDAVRHYYAAHDLRVHVVPELTYVVVEHVDVLGPDRVVVTLCEADGSWQMDRRGTPDPADDAVWNDQLVSRRATHELVRTSDGWRRRRIVLLDEWRGENRCPPPAA